MPKSISAWAAAASSANLAGLISQSSRPLEGANPGYGLPEANGIVSASREDVRAAQLRWLVRHWDVLIYRLTGSQVEMFPQKEWHAILTVETHGRNTTTAMDTKAAARRENMHTKLMDCLAKGRKEVSYHVYSFAGLMLMNRRAASTLITSTMPPHNGTAKSSTSLLRSKPPSCSRFSGS